MDFLKSFWDMLVTGKEKAVAAAVVAAVASFLMQHYNLHVGDDTKQLVVALVAGVLLHQSVYWTNNSK